MSYTPSLLDPSQIIKSAFDETAQCLRTTVVDASASNQTVISSYQVAFGSINGSGGALYEIVATTASLADKLIINDQTGISLSLYTGLGSGTLFCILAPGFEGELPCNFAAGTRITVKSTGASAPSAGALYVVVCG